MKQHPGGLENDLKLTVRELSDTYEELTLLYRLSGTLSGLDIDEICDKILDEALSSVGAETAAVMLLDESKDELVTNDCKGKWSKSFTLKKDDSPFWQAISKGKPIGICNPTTQSLPKNLSDIKYLLISPMIGKKKVIGILIVADRLDNEEFYSNDIKLISAIACQAALFIENSVLIKEMETFLIGTIRSFVKALEASSMWTAGHTERVTEYALTIGREMNLDPALLERLKICSLLHDIGKIATPNEILNKDGYLSEEEWNEIKRHPIIGAGILEGLERFSDVIECIKYHHERYDGNESIFGLKGEDIPLLSRILAVADTFDAMTSDRPYRVKKSIRDAVEEIVSLSGSQFDPKVISAFERWINRKIGIEF